MSELGRLLLERGGSGSYFASAFYYPAMSYEPQAKSDGLIAAGCAAGFRGRILTAAEWAVED
jgi:hypothetical protein